MPERDSAIDIDDLPKIQAEKRDGGTPPPGRGKKSGGGGGNNKPPASPSVNPLWVTGAILLLLAGVLLLAWQTWEQSQQLQMAGNRIAVLENQLSSTDESITQSSVALQVRLNELKERTDELWTQMDKLWASAWRRNQSELSDQGKRIEQLKKTMESLEGKVAGQQSSLGSLRTEVAGTKVDIEALKGQTRQLAAAVEKANEQQADVANLRRSIQSLEQGHSELKKLAEENAGWVESNNAFRLQTNRKLSELEREIKAIQSPGP